MFIVHVFSCILILFGAYLHNLVFTLCFINFGVKNQPLNLPLLYITSKDCVNLIKLSNIKIKMLKMLKMFVESVDFSFVYTLGVYDIPVKLNGSLWLQENIPPHFSILWNIFGNFFIKLANFPITWVLAIYSKYFLFTDGKWEIRVKSISE